MGKIGCLDLKLSPIGIDDPARHDKIIPQFLHLIVCLECISKGDNYVTSF